MELKLKHSPIPKLIEYDSSIAITKHPAKYSKKILEAIQEIVSQYKIRKILDPFGGEGSSLSKILDDNKYKIYSIDIEPEWAACAAQYVDFSYCGDSTYLAKIFKPEYFDAIITSSCYGNRCADNYFAYGRTSDTSRRTYAQYLGRYCTDGSAGKIKWSDEYRDLHTQVWKECFKVLKPNGIFIFNIKNFPKDNKIIKVAQWHKQTIINIGFGFINTKKVYLKGDQNTNRTRSKGKLTIDYEYIYTFRKPK